MGKIYQALERSTSNSHDCMRNSAILDDGGQQLSIQVDATFESVNLQGLESIKTNFLARYADGSTKTVLFSGVSPGCGTSTVAANFAACLAKDTRVKVLLVDANLRSPSLHHFFPAPGQTGLLDLLYAEELKGFEINKPGKDTLYVLASGGVCDQPVQQLESRRFTQFLEKIREEIDFIIFDGPLSSVYPESKAICSKVDGVVLVAEAGRSRRQAAFRIKKEFEDAGGRILGTVLNKRNYYIPEWLYRRL